MSKPHLLDPQPYICLPITTNVIFIYLFKDMVPGVRLLKPQQQYNN